jgi:tetratricopeptide (TPR) repeat protein
MKTTLKNYGSALLGLAVLVSSGTGCTKQARASQHLARGDRYFAAGDYDRAEIEYLKVLNPASPDPAACAKLGFIYYDEGRYVRAWDYLKRAAKLTPNDPLVRLKLSLAELDIGHLDAARTNAELVLRIQPGQEEALEVLVKSTRTTNLAATVKQINNLRQSGSDRPGYHIALGSLYLRQAHLTNTQNELNKALLASAQSEFNKALEMDPKLPATHEALAGLYLQQGDTNRANQAFQEAIRLSPLRSRRRLDYAYFKVNTESVEAGKRIATEITEKTPDFLPAWMLLARIAASENKLNESAGLVQKVLAREPDGDLGAFLLQGELCLREGDGTNAALHFERALKLSTNCAPAVFGLAKAQLVNNQPAAAMANLERAIKFDPNYVDAIVQQASLNLRQGNAAQAVAPLSRLATNAPNLPQPQLLLARAYAIEGRKGDAVRTYRGLTNTFGHEPAVLLDVAYNLASLGQTNDAAAVYRQAVGIATNAQALTLAGMFLGSLNDKSDARRAFEKSLSFAPAFLPAIEGLMDLDVAEGKENAATARVQQEIDKNPGAPLPWLLLAKLHLKKAYALVKKENDSLPGGSKPRHVADVPAAQDEVHAAETALQKAIELDPKLPASYQILADLYVSLKQEQQALKVLNSWTGTGGTNDLASLVLIGKIQEQLKDFPAAQAAYEKALKVNPKAVEPLNNLAALYADDQVRLDRAYELAQRAYEFAQKGYELKQKAHQEMPGDAIVAAAAADTLGWVLFRRGEYAQAAGLIQEAANTLTKQPEIQLHLGMVRYILGQAEDARTHLQNAAQSAVDFRGKEQATNLLAILSIDVKTAGPAQVAELEKRLKETPRDLSALARLGAIQERDGAVDKAIETYRAQLQYSPENAQVMFKLAQLYRKSPGHEQKAFEMARQAHSAAPEEPHISALLGELVFQKGDDYGWSASLLDASARKLPDDSQVWYDLAWAQYSLGDLRTAEGAMQTAVGKASSLEGQRIDDARRFLALLPATKDVAVAAQAAAQAQSIVKTQADYVPALMVCGLDFEGHGKYPQAAQCYEKALTRFPLFAPATKSLALLYFERLGDDVKAYELATRARQTYRDDPALAKTLGVISYRKREYPKAVQFLRETTRSGNEDAEALYYLGMAQYELKARRECKAALQTALDSRKLQPKLAEKAQQVLAELK